MTNRLTGDNSSVRAQGRRAAGRHAALRQYHFDQPQCEHVDQNEQPTPQFPIDWWEFLQRGTRGNQLQETAQSPSIDHCSLFTVHCSLFTVPVLVSVAVSATDSVNCVWPCPLFLPLPLPLSLLMLTFTVSVPDAAHYLACMENARKKGQKSRPGQTWKSV